MYFTDRFKDFLTLGSTNLVSRIIYGLFWLFLASLLLKEEYGELGFLMGIINVASSISLLGLPATIVVYEPKKENIFPVSFVTVIFSASIALGITFVLTQNIVASILVLGLTTFNILLAGLNVQKLYRSYSIHNILRSIITVILAIILYQFLGINGVLLGYLITTVFVLREFSKLRNNRKIEFSVLKSKISFAVHMFSNRLSGVILWWGDKILIGALFGFSFLGNYQFAAQYLLLLEAIPRSIGQYLLPHEAEGTKNKKIKLFSIVISVLITIISIIIVPFGVTAFLPHYNESILPMQIMSIAIIPFTIIAIQTSEFLGKEKSRIVLIGSFLQAGLYVLLIIIFGYMWDIIGIAIGLVISTITRTIFNFVASFFMGQEKA